MKVDVYKNSFNAGELSSYMLGRSDLPDYANGCQTLKNWLVRPQGGIVKRSGTRFVRQVTDSSQVCRLVPFVYSTTQAYILEFSEDLVRFFMDEGTVLETAQAITSITKADPAVVTIAGHGFATGEMVFITGTTDMPEVNDRHFTITVLNGNEFELDDEDSSGYGTAATDGTGARVYQITTTYTEAELPDLQFAQSADQLYIVHPDHAPAILSRTAHTSWSLDDMEFIDGPYLELRVEAVGEDWEADTVQVNPAASVGTNILTVCNVNLWDATRDVGRMIRKGDANDGLSWGGMRIVSVTDAKNCHADIVSGDVGWENPPQLPDSTTTKWWHMGAYYVDNYPRTVAFFEGRLAFAGTPLEPERLDASVTGGWDDFRPTTRADISGGGAAVTADEAISFQLGGANDVQVILWLATIRNLIIGTTGGIWPVQASSSNEAVTPLNINVPRAGSHGAAAVQPVTTQDTVIYVSWTGKRVLSASYSYEPDSYQTRDLTLRAEHVTGSGISFMAYQLEPHNMIWCVRGDGQLAALTFEREQNVYAWARHVVGGTFGSGDAVVESVAVIPAPNEDHDQVWLIVKRTIDGNTVRYVEFMEQDFADDDDLEDAYFVDAGYTYTGSAVSTIQNLQHLEGETVQVFADGEELDDETVAGGAITLGDTYSTIHVGYAYDSDAETMPIFARDTRFVSQGKKLRPLEASLRLHRTLGLEIGPDASSLDEIFAATETALVSGIREKRLVFDHEEEQALYIRQGRTLPACVLSISAPVWMSQR